jgi:hypothetical protein
VATHATSLYDELGNRRPDFGLRDVLGVSYRGWLNYSTSFLTLVPGMAISEGLSQEKPLALGSTQLKVWLQDGEVAARIVAPILDYSLAPQRITWGDPPPGPQTPYPAVVTRQHGAGRVVYFAGMPGRAYFQRGYPHCRHMLNNALFWAAGERPPIELDGGMGLKLTAFRQSTRDRLIVHLVNLQAVPGHNVQTQPTRRAGQLNWAYPIEEIVPAYDVQLRVARSNRPRRVYLAPHGAEMEYDFVDGWLCVTVPKVAYHAMVVVEDE